MRARPRARRGLELGLPPLRGSRRVWLQLKRKVGKISLLANAAGKDSVFSQALSATIRKQDLPEIHKHKPWGSVALSSRGHSSPTSSAGICAALQGPSRAKRTSLCSSLSHPWGSQGWEQPAAQLEMSARKQPTNSSQQAQALRVLGPFTGLVQRELTSGIKVVATNEPKT